jgi:hypothetical protein
LRNDPAEYGGRKAVVKMSKTRGLLNVAVCAALMFSLWGCGDGSKAPGAGGAKPPKPAPPKTAAEIEAEARKKRKELVAKKRAELNNTEWQINILPVPSKDKEAESDILRFSGKKVYSVKYDSLGYHASNYNLRIKSGNVVWETMQSEEDGKGVMFWRGDWRGEKMTGAISLNPEKGKNKSFRFTSVSSKEIPPPPPEEKEKKK